MAKPTLAQHAENNEAVSRLLAGSLGHKVVAERIVASGFPTSETAVRRYRRNLQWSPEEQHHDAVNLETLEEQDLVEQVDRLKQANRRLFKSLHKAKKDRAEYLETLYEAVQDARDNTDRPKSVAPPTRDKRKNKKPEAAVWHLTDWQGGKKTSSYDMDVMDKRVIRYTEKAAELTEIMRADHPVTHAEVLFGGDMVEGVQIFPGQVWELDGTLFEQIFRVSDRMTWAVEQALQIYETVGVAAEWGNHGRIGKKGDGLKASDNVDRICYEITRRDLINKGYGDRLTHFRIWDKWYQRFEIGNYAALLVHGDEIKSFGGNTPSYGILRKANSWASGVIPGGFRDVYIGHYHQQMMLQLANGGAVFMTGSTESDNEYAREFVAAVSAPSQRLNFVDPGAGRVTYESNIWVNE